ncbi:hypothetical protein IL306_009647 [Fusarium sp. DS 682]|nr:hypothetical protein IL306_009647 [Fusarium sp. DS 682]
MAKHPDGVREGQKRADNKAPVGRQHTFLSTPAHDVNAAPQHVAELRPFGVVNAEGRLIGLRFRNPSGGPDTNVMADSDICPGAMIYQASFAACRTYLVQDTGSRIVELRLRFVDSMIENAQPGDEIMANGETDDFAVILIPYGAQIPVVEGHPHSLF